MDFWPRRVNVPESSEPDDFMPKSISEIFSKRFSFLEIALQKAESPIEEKMADGLWVAFRDLLESRPKLIEPQAVIGRYRADFHIELKPHRWSPFLGIVVECDGEEFHRDPEQRKHDKRRDAWMRENMLCVLRFTGAEIYRSAHTCADRVREVFNVYEPESRRG